MDEDESSGAPDQAEEIKELIKTRRWDLIVKWCEKKQKKGDKSDFVQIWRIIASLHDPKIDIRKRARSDLVILLDRRPPVAEASALLLLEDLFQTYHSGTELSAKLGSIWERAADSLTRNEWVLRLWYRTKFLKGRYKEAKQAIMIWLKAFPKSYDPFYLFILLNFVIYREATATPIDKNLSQLLAFRVLATAATDTVDDQGHLIKQPGRRLISHQDVFLLLHIYKDQSKFHEALKFLESPTTGLISPLCNRKWEFALELIEMQYCCQRWDLLSATCSEILVQALPQTSRPQPSGLDLSFGERGDDWYIWKRYIEATGKLASASSNRLIQAEDLIAKFRALKSRNAQQALFKLYSEDPTSKEMLNKLFSECKSYFIVHSSKPACFQDLRPYLAVLPRPDQQAFLNEIGQFRSDIRSPAVHSGERAITSEINILKLEYHMLVSRDIDLSNDAQWHLFVQACLQLYEASLKLNLWLPKSDRGPGDDAAILAAMSLLYMYKAGVKHCLLQSIMVLEYLLANSRHNYDALLLVIRLYMHIGAGSLAMDRYARLNIKNIQHASMPWVLYDRLSTIHPWAAEISADGTSRHRWDPLIETSISIEWHRKAGCISEKATKKMLDNLQWGMVLDMMSTVSVIQAGVLEIMAFAQDARIRRLRDDETMGQAKMCMNVPERVYDNRDRAGFPNHQPANQVTLEQSLPTIQLSNEQEMNGPIRELLMNHAWDLLNNKQWSRDNERKLDQLQANLEMLRHDEATTYPDAWLWKIVSAIKSVIRTKNCHVQSSYLAVLQQMKQYLEHYILKDQTLADGHHGCIGLSNDLKMPLWTFYHIRYTVLDATLFISRYMEFVKQSGIAFGEPERKALKMSCLKVEELVQHVRHSLLEQTKRLHDMLRKPESQYLPKLYAHVGASGTSGINLTSLLRTSFDCERMCAQVRDSWIDGLVGLERSISGSSSSRAG